MVEIPEQDFLGDVGFEKPLLELAVVVPQLAVELAGQSDDGLLVADIGLAETAGRHAPDRYVRTDDGDPAAEPGRGIGRRDAGGAAAIDAYFVPLTAGEHGQRQSGKEQDPGFHGDVFFKCSRMV